MKKGKISDNTIRRLPRYLRALDTLMERGDNQTSSLALGRLLGFTASQVRQDFSYFGEFGRQGYGYHIPTLRENISRILGMHRYNNAILVGCGNIGKALLCNFDFSNYGFKLLCGFDTNPKIVGTILDGVEIKPVEELESYLTNNHVDLAVLCVPKDIARQVADVLVKNGINAIWNFTNTDVVDPYSPIIVENIHFSDNLLSLSYYIKEKA